MSYKHKWPCRCSKCGARKTLNMMPHQYKLDKHRNCLCGGELRVDWYRKKKENKAPCKCDGYHYPHRKGGGVWCKNHPTGPSEQDYLNRYGDYAETSQELSMNEKLIKYQAAVFANAAEGEKLGYLCQLIQIYNANAIRLHPNAGKCIAFTLSAGGWIFNHHSVDALFDNNRTLDQLISIVEGLLDEACFS